MTASSPPTLPWLQFFVLKFAELSFSSKKIEIDRKLAKNNLLPNLDMSLEAGQILGGNRPKEIEQNEIEAKIEFKLPLQRRDA